MSTNSSVLLWLDAAREGDDGALEKLWKRFSERMISHSERWLGRMAEQVAFDADDVTVTAFEAFCRALVDGRYQELRGSDELWRLLAVITTRKAIDLLESEKTQKRGAGRALFPWMTPAPK